MPGVRYLVTSFPKRPYYPTLRDGEAMNPDGSKLRADGRSTRWLAIVVSPVWWS